MTASTAKILAHPGVRRVAAALDAAGSTARPVALEATARTAEDAARALGVEVGQIVKSLVFLVGGRPVLALVAGDRRCRPESLPQLLGLEGPVARADAETVREATGFAIGGVAPVGHPAPLPCAVDSSLARFDRLWAAAGHPHAVFPTSFPELLRLTRGIAGEIAEVAPG
ncbi:MAG: aminoacyl-tRNA deacylase [Geminicoccaceae bacterium]|nr:MAG: aminoacyl-tRNA deacylase [Geminicoccaceae bacterium]